MYKKKLLKGVSKLKYSEEAKYIWQNYVPKSGQADTVQGELIRAIEKLRFEAQDNGNMNWDEGFVHFCDYIWEVLNSWGKFNNEALSGIRIDLNRILDFENPYYEDDLYNRISDYIIQWYLQNKEPIKREIDPNLHR